MIHMIGNAHIDPVWMWQWQEGYQEVKATFKSALDRLSETEEFVFTCACADYYRWVEENDPEMFEEISQRMKEGRWRIVGGMWTQPDCNMPSGESFVRQFLYSQRYFYEKFGVTAKTAYNVDSFGHNAMLPQIFKKAGIDSYVMMRPSRKENPNIPGWLFDWYSPDGSHVRTFRIMDSDGYCSSFGDCDKRIENALSAQKELGYPMMCFYGVGNHGGGPTIANLKAIKAYQAAHPEDEIIFSSPDEYFECVKDIEVPRWESEMQHHASGCYSATSLVKRYNRKAENALLAAETMGVMGAGLAGHKIGDMTQGWRNVMFNQFHDVMCGCSIKGAYEDARNQLGEAIAIAAREQNAAVQKISWKIDTMAGMPGRKRSKESHFRLWELNGQGTPLVVFNPHAFPVKQPVQLYGKTARATDHEGNEMPLQVVRASRTNGTDKWDSIIMADVPAMGYRLYWIYLEGETMQAENGLKVGEDFIENAKIAARFDKKTGALVSLVDKTTGYEAISAPAMMRLFDVEFADTWAHMEFTFDDPKGDFGDAVITVKEEGPVRAKIRVRTKCGNNVLIQDYSLGADDDMLTVDAKLDMGEKFRMAKLCFPVNAENPVARAEIAYGAIERKCDGCEETGQKWMEVGGDEGGLAIINDSKYSFSAPGNELRLTVANTSIFADHYGQKDRDEDCPHMDMGMQEFRYAIVPHGGKWQDAGLSRRGLALNTPLISIVETYHEGELPAVYEGAKISAENVNMGAIKRAENGQGWVVRLNETCGKAVKAEIELGIIGRKLVADMGAYEIKTLYIPNEGDVREVPVTEIF